MPTFRLLCLTGIVSLGVSSCASMMPAAQNGRPAGETSVAEAFPDPQTGQDAEPALPDEDGYRIRAGDVLEILVWRNEELSRVVTVRPEGQISVPLLNEVPAAGLTPEELRARLISRISEYIPDPEVSVLVQEVRSFNVSVMGEVKQPGRYDLRSRTTVLEALALAGGLTEFASKGGIRVLRSDGNPDTRSIAFDYRGAIQGDPEVNFPLRPGDIIVVP